MKEFNPPQELLNLDLVLRFNKEHTPILSRSEKVLINYARSKIIRNDNYSLDNNLKNKIDFTIAKIEKENWKPEYPIIYNKLI